MFFRRRYPTYPPPSARRPGCPGCLLVLATFALVCWLLIVQNGTLARVVGNTLSILTPSSLLTGLALTQPSPSPGETYQVTGKPSLRVAFINTVLALAHSPAAGTGQALYDLSVQSGIDDAYALAFFEHESAFGTTGVARATLSLGNIRCSTGYVCLSGYRAYSSWVAGYADWYHLIRALYVNQWHLLTVAQIIPVYAPVGDGNDVPGYIRAVEHAVDTWRHGEVQL